MWDVREPAMFFVNPVKDVNLNGMVNLYQNIASMCLLCVLLFSNQVSSCIFLNNLPYQIIMIIIIIVTIIIIIIIIIIR